MGSVSCEEGSRSDSKKQTYHTSLPVSGVLPSQMMRLLLFSITTRVSYCISYVCLVTQLYLTLYDSMDCNPPGSFLHVDSPGKNTGAGCHALLQGIFPIQWLNTSLLHCRRIIYHLSHQGSPIFQLHSIHNQTEIQGEKNEKCIKEHPRFWAI